MYDPSGHDLLRDAGAEVKVVDTTDAQEVAAALKDADALWVRTPERVTSDLLAAANGLVVVSTSGFGTNNVDIEAATERGILVVNHQGFGRVSVAEHSVMLILAALKKLTWCDQATRNGSAWAERSAMSIHELEAKTVGLVGLGYIGAELARKLHLGFRCRVLAYDPYVNPRLSYAVEAEMHDDLETMLAACQVLCLCAELTGETRMIIGAKELAALPRGAVVVNAARGELLDLDALAETLDSGHVAGWASAARPSQYRVHAAHGGRHRGDLRHARSIGSGSDRDRAKGRAPAIPREPRSLGRPGVTPAVIVETK